MLSFAKKLLYVCQDKTLGITSKLFGSQNSKLIKSWTPIIKQINLEEEKLKRLTDDQLREKTSELKQLAKSGVSLDVLLPEAFALVREGAVRVLKMRHFDVQLIGGIALHKGMIAEMKTGEGKTLMSTLAAYLNALTEKGVHIVTVNDYLAHRDSEWMGNLYKFLGLSVGCITNAASDRARQEAYNADILYATNNELGFDYLRDNMKFSIGEVVQRPLNYVIIDEIDSILIDEARTPLIISGAVNENIGIYEKIDKLVKKLNFEDVEIDEKHNQVILTEKGLEKVELLLKESGLITAQSNLYEVTNINFTHYIEQALKAHKLFQLDRDYILKDNQVLIIDEFTGRMMQGRRYSEGLHQAIEAKEKVRVNQENQTLASITFQNYFRMYKKMAGMTGTASTESEEFRSIYNIAVLPIPTHLPLIRKDEEDEIYCTEVEKLETIIQLIKQSHEKKQPVLVGTVSIAKSEKISALLKELKLRHSVLNARYHEQEAHIIAQAGRPGAITIATNMAGRGTDIQLGGNPDLLREQGLSEEQFLIDKKTVLQAGGLYVIGTERHESRRIDNQLRGRSGRQGDPGSSKFFLSLEDDLLRIFGATHIQKILKTLGIKNGEAITHPWITKALEKAQKKVEHRNYEMRKSLLKYDDVINEQRKVIFTQRQLILKNKEYDFTALAGQVNEQILEEALIEEGDYDIELLENSVFRIYGVRSNNLSNPNSTPPSEIAKITEEALFFNTDLLPAEVIDDIKKKIMLLTIDQLWKEHLNSIDHLKKGISFRALGQKNPLNEFKKEAFTLFHNMLKEINELIISRYIKLIITIKRDIEQPKQYINRNDLCFCGSNKKYKHCHGKIN